MADHPSTPMRGADLARHLTLQTTIPVANVSFIDLGNLDLTKHVGRGI